jgi:glycosyltransferase involved in cell wall biosynthesis
MLPAVSVVVPCFNEAERIGETLRVALNYLANAAPGSELIVVNDGSTDETGERIRAVLTEPTNVETQVLENFPNRGKGAAVRTGLLAATRPIGLFMDADLSTPIDEMPKLVEPIAAGEEDLTFGSRALNRDLIGHHQPWRREQAGRVFNLLVRLATGLPYWDTQCGFKAFRLAACRPILERARVIGFGFDVELLYLAEKAQLRLREIPVRWNHCEGSKIRVVRDSLHMLREIFSLRAAANITALVPSAEPKSGV